MSENKVLKLTLKKKWFDMILSGEKKEEYREVKDFWMKRIVGVKGCGTSYNFSILNNIGNKCIEYTHIEFTNGYGAKMPRILVECKGIIIDEGKQKWGAPNYRVFIIRLGNITERHNIN
jgi:hypothetical protein